MLRVSLFVFLLLSPARQDKPGQVHMKKVPDPARDWALYLPNGYNPRQTYPLVVSSHGRGGRGKGEINQWKAPADKHKFIVACADYSKASGREGTFEQDEQVALYLYDWCVKNYPIDRNYVMITGFSGGGLPTYNVGSQHPDKFRYWCPRSANYYAHIVKDEDLKNCVDVPVYIYYGEKDHELILKQAPQAYERLKKAGFKDIRYEKVPGMGHSSRAPLAADWFMGKVREHRERERLMQPAYRNFARADKAMEKNRLKTAVSELKKASRHMKKYKLGDEADKRIAVLADAEWRRIEAADDAEKKKLLEKASKAFVGTDHRSRFSDALKALGK